MQYRAGADVVRCRTAQMQESSDSVQEGVGLDRYSTGESSKKRYVDRAGGRQDRR